MNERDLFDLGGGTVGGLLATRAAAVPNKTAIEFENLSFTYGELDHEATRIALGLIELGVEFGQSVGMFMSNRMEFVSGWLGLCRAGQVQVCVNTAYKGTFLESALSDTDVHVLITESKLAKVVGELGKLPGSVTAIVFADGVPADLPDLGVRILDWEALRRLGDASTAQLPVVRPGDTVSIQLTSGTTGKSKGVVAPHLYAITAARENAVGLGTLPSDRLYTCLPMFHGAAQVNICLHAFYLGATAILGARFSGRTFWQEVREHDATFFNALGSLLPVLLAQPASELDRAHRVRRIFAAPARPEVLIPFEDRFGVQIVEGYGLTETKMMTFNPLHSRKIGSIGVPTATCEMDIHDDDGNPLPHGQVGEIVYRPKRGNVMFSRYHRDPEATLNSLRGLWFCTGDLGYADHDGYYYFVDRKKDALRRRGENISSQEVEAVLQAFDGVKEAAAVAAASPLGEDEVMAVLEIEGSIDLLKLFDHCDRHLPYFMVPRYYLSVADLPRTPTGKIQKAVLRAGGVTAETWDADEAGHKPTRHI